MFEPLKEELGEGIATSVRPSIKVLAWLVGGLFFLTMWTTAYEPAWNRLCNEATGILAQGEFDVCVIGRAARTGAKAFFAWLDSFAGTTGADGSGGPMTAEQLAAESGFNLTAGTHEWDIRLQTDIPEGNEETVLAPTLIYAKPFKDSSGSNQVGQANIGDIVTVYLLVLTEADKQWVRITPETAQAHKWIPALVVQGPNSDLPPLPSPQPLTFTDMVVEGPWGNLPQGAGPVVENGLFQGQYAIDAWAIIRDQGAFEIDQNTLWVLYELQEYGNLWKATFDEYILLAKVVDQTQDAVNATINSGYPEEVEEALLTGLNVFAANNIVWKVAQMEKPLILDDGTWPVYLQAEVTIGDVAHELFGWYAIEARYLRMVFSDREIYVDNTLQLDQGGE